MTIMFLPLLITLEEDLMVQVPLDPARRVSATMIPGRALQGLLAYALRHDAVAVTPPGQRHGQRQRGRAPP